MHQIAIGNGRVEVGYADVEGQELCADGIGAGIGKSGEGREAQMKVVGTPINAATDPVLLDPRDYARLRARMLELEERMLKVENEQLAADITIKNLVGEVRDQRKLVLDLQRQFALFMSGTKERFDVLGLLLPQSETPLDRKDV